MYSVMGGKARLSIQLMLENPAPEITRYAGVKDARFAGHDVNVTTALHKAGPSRMIFRLRTQDDKRTIGWLCVRSHPEVS
jgi:hypothetical protein